MFHWYMHVIFTKHEINYGMCLYKRQKIFSSHQNIENTNISPLKINERFSFYTFKKAEVFRTYLWLQHLGLPEDSSIFHL